MSDSEKRRGSKPYIKLPPAPSEIPNLK